MARTQREKGGNPERKGREPEEKRAQTRREKGENPERKWQEPGEKKAGPGVERAGTRTGKGGNPGRRAFRLLSCVFLCLFCFGLLTCPTNSNIF